MPTLDCVVIEPKQPATATVIWLHGLGANGHDFEPIVPELQLPDSLAVRFIFPHAPAIPVTVNGGMVMPAWYDILSMDIDRKVDESGVIHSAEAINQLIEQEVNKGIPSERIVIAGFSQGGAVAYQCALHNARPLAGLLTLSTYIATDIQPSAANQSLPIMINHGAFDPVVQEVLGKKAQATLQELGFAPTFKSYPMEHMVCLEQIRDIGQWLSERLA